MRPSEPILAARERLAGAKSLIAERHARAVKLVREHRAQRAEMAEIAAAHGLLLALADSARDVVRSRVEDVVTLALQSVFGDTMRFRFDVRALRGVVGMVPMVGYGGNVWMPLDEVGGGVVDVVAFALRVTLIVWRQPAARQVLIADEPFKHVSDDYLPNVAAMLRKLADATELQMVIVSHEPTIAASADKVIEVSRSGGYSKLKTVIGAVP